jgi:hypothetical protein
VKRSVHFDDTAIVVHEIGCIHDARRVELWYTKAEYYGIKLRDSVVVDYVQNGFLEESEKRTMRGLERLFTKDHRNALVAVLDEQNLQSARSMNIPLIIALEYAMLSQNSREIARERGLRDAEKTTPDNPFAKGRSLAYMRRASFTVRDRTGLPLGAMTPVRYRWVKTWKKSIGSERSTGPCSQRSIPTLWQKDA